MTATSEVVVRERVRRGTRRRRVVTVLLVLVVVAFAVTLMVGRTFYPPADVMRVILGQDVPGASYTVGRLRLPRAVLAIAAGLCFGMAGVTFQTMLRNPLASPDIIGISAGSSAAAAFAIVTLSLGSTAVSVFAIVSGLAVALLVYVLSFKDGVVGTRLILIGIGIAAMLDSVTAYILSRAAQWDLQEATRWLTGSLNGTTWPAVVPVLIALVVLTPVLLGQGRSLAVTQLGDDMAPALGVRVGRTRLLVIVAAVGLIAFATAAAGPIAFVAFLCGPIAARLIGPAGSLLVPSALVGALLVLVADFVGQYALASRYPVGIVTGVLGAPYLIYLITRSNRVGGSI
ncbi:ABC transporter permease [Rhodococcoides trifolii]|uniref:ABC transporter permease n=1 Tax=Rhodococcoides trifolii TaxID=908250 RepID=A0A917CLV5_9NOCA|nr:iron chelate uptake ABC transporter family permease subunit [Rhodococcus trifolii]GGF91552.1 ABC transporter permease [Rhodococcus trifolii]